MSASVLAEHTDGAVPCCMSVCIQQVSQLTAEPFCHFVPQELCRRAYQLAITISIVPTRAVYPF